MILTTFSEMPEHDIGCKRPKHKVMTRIRSKAKFKEVPKAKKPRLHNITPREDPF